MEISRQIREAIEASGIGADAWRRRYGFSNGTFYDWLRGCPVVKLASIERLRAAGVAVPGLTAPAKTSSARRGQRRQVSPRRRAS